eukprot:884962_1
MQRDLTPEELQDIYKWIDEVPLSRVKRNISRDFSDAEPTADAGSVSDSTNSVMNDILELVNKFAETQEKSESESADEFRTDSMSSLSAAIRDLVKEFTDYGIDEE